MTVEFAWRRLSHGHQRQSITLCRRRAASEYNYDYYGDLNTILMGQTSEYVARLIRTITLFIVVGERKEGNEATIISHVITRIKGACNLWP